MSTGEFRCHPAWRYACLHVPSGNTFARVLGPELDIDRRAFLALLNRWNAQQPGVWQYWTRDV